MRHRRPIRMCLRPIRIPKRNMHSRQFFILQQNPNHLAQSQIRPKRQFPDAIAVLIGMTIIPKFFLEIPPLAAHRFQSRPGDLQNHRRIPQAPILRIEMIPSRPIANKSPIHALRRSKNFPRRQIRPIPRANQSRSLHPIERAIESSRNRSPALRRNPQQIRRPHPVAQTIAQPVHLAVIRPHPLLHNLRRNAHHVRITNPPPLHNPHNLPPRRQVPQSMAESKVSPRQPSQAPPKPAPAHPPTAAANNPPRKIPASPPCDSPAPPPAKPRLRG